MSYPITYYVNGTRRHYDVIAPEDVFILVGTTTLEPSIGDTELRSILERAFFRLNRVTEDNYDPMLDERGAPSCSVGDVLVWGEVAWIVKGAGFETVSTEAWVNVRKDTEAVVVSDAVYALRMAAW